MSDKSPPEITLPQTTTIEIRGWHTEDESAARAFGERLMALTRELSRHLDLSRLSRIILAFDYHKALTSVRGEDGVTDVATSNEFGEGAAMSVTVQEEGSFKSVIVAYTPLVSSMFDDEDTAAGRASLQSYVHELIHVDDHAFLDKTFPGGSSAAIATSDLHGALLAMVVPARAEYEATRRTAHIEPSTGLQFLDLLSSVLADLDEEVRRERRRYNRREVTLEDFWPWLQERFRFLFQSLGYALGHADAVLTNEETPQETLTEYRRFIADIEATKFGWLVEATRAAILPIYEQEEWTGLDVFDSLIDVARTLLREFGVDLRPLPSGYWVDVPPSWDSELD